MRGAAGTIVLVEEMAFMDEEFWRTVIVPLFMTGASFIGITTLEKPGNWVGILIDIVRDDGTHLIETVALTFSCEECKNAGLASKCTHAEFDRPRWQDPQTLKDIELMNIGNKDDYNREALGINTDSTTARIYDKNAIEDMYRSVYNPDQDYQTVIVAVDPAGRGTGSRFAIVSAVFTSEKMLVKK